MKLDKFYPAPHIQYGVSASVNYSYINDILPFLLYRLFRHYDLKDSGSPLLWPIDGEEETEPADNQVSNLKDISLQCGDVTSLRCSLGRKKTLLLQPTLPVPTPRRLHTP